MNKHPVSLGWPNSDSILFGILHYFETQSNIYFFKAIFPFHATFYTFPNYARWLGCPDDKKIVSANIVNRVRAVCSVVLPPSLMVFSQLCSAAGLPYIYSIYYICYIFLLFFILFPTLLGGLLALMTI